MHAWRRAGLILSLGLGMGAADPPPLVKHVILLLSDGTAPEAWTLARWVKGHPLQVDSILSGAVRTYGSDSLISDSAPGATAYACGQKAEDKTLAMAPRRTTVPGLSPAEVPGKPLPTLLEGARLQGRAVGLIATSPIQHATPAAFSAHGPHREDFEAIAWQQVHQGMDVVLGGGLQSLVHRKDGRDLVAQLQRQGVQVVRTAEAMEAVPRAPVWGAFADRDMAYELDRPRFAPQEPSLAAMTRKALSLLAADPKGQRQGLFLFVEGSKVDWAAHANDPVGVVSELLAFDDAAGEALAFARTHPDTLVVVLSDHATGGLSIGVREWPSYSQTQFLPTVGPLRRAQLTAEGLALLVKRTRSHGRDAALRQVAAEWGLEDLTEGERQAVAEAVKRLRDHPEDSALADLMGPLLSRRAGLGWTTGGHTGADVTLFSAGPGRLIGLWENDAIGRHLAAAMGFSFDQLSRRLCVQAQAAAQAAGLSCTVDLQANVLRLGFQGRCAELPLGTRYLRLPDRTDPVHLEGLVLHNPSDGHVYVPAHAVEVAVQALRPLKKAG